MIGASGVGKTAFFLYPNLEYACASGMSYLALDTKGDLARNYGAVASKYYGYQVSVIDLRNPTRSDGNNLLTHLHNAAALVGAACGSVLDTVTTDLPNFPTNEERPTGDNDIRCANLAEQLGFHDCRAFLANCDALAML